MLQVIVRPFAKWEAFILLGNDEQMCQLVHQCLKFDYFGCRLESQPAVDTLSIWSLSSVKLLSLLHWCKLGCKYIECIYLCCIVQQFVSEEVCLVGRAYDAIYAYGVLIEALGKIIVRFGILLTRVLWIYMETRLCRFGCALQSWSLRPCKIPWWQSNDVAYNQCQIG